MEEFETYRTFLSMKQNFNLQKVIGRSKDFHYFSDTWNHITCFERSDECLCCLSSWKARLRAPIKCLKWRGSHSTVHRQKNQTCHYIPKSQAPLPTEVSLKLLTSYRQKNFESDLSSWSLLSGNVKILRTDTNRGKGQG